ncbi:MAG: pilin [bacterium]
MRYLRHFFVLIFALQLLGLGIIWLEPQQTLAADKVFEPTAYKPQVPIPGVKDGSYDFGTAAGFKLGDPSTAPIAEYIKWVYKYLIGIVGILATVMLMYGGFRWIMGAADSGAINEAKDTIASSLIGLTLAVSSYLILATVNPDLVNFKTRSIASIAPVGCCIGESTCSKSSQCTTGNFLAGGVCSGNQCMTPSAATQRIIDLNPELAPVPEVVEAQTKAENKPCPGYPTETGYVCKMGKAAKLWGDDTCPSGTLHSGTRNASGCPTGYDPDADGTGALRDMLCCTK